MWLTFEHRSDADRPRTRRSNLPGLPCPWRPGRRRARRGTRRPDDQHLPERRTRGPGPRHLLDVVDDDHVTAQQNLLFVDSATGEQRSALYDDELVRTPDGWRIAQYHLTIPIPNDPGMVGVDVYTCYVSFQSGIFGISKSHSFTIQP